MALLARDISGIIFGGSICALFGAGSRCNPFLLIFRQRKPIPASARYLVAIGMAASALHPMLNVGV